MPQMFSEKVAITSQHVLGFTFVDSFFVGVHFLLSKSPDSFPIISMVKLAKNTGTPGKINICRKTLDAFD